MLRPVTLFVAAMLFMLAVRIVCAQTTDTTYQGRLTAAMAPANGNYDLEFHLFSVASGGTAIGTLLRPGVAVVEGIFTVSLDFGPTAFDGTDRWLEITVSGTQLLPRQQVKSAPYAIRAIDSTKLNGIADTGFIQNTATPQAAANFSISGSGTAGGTLGANIVNANSHFSLSGARILSVTGGGPYAGSNTLAGIGAGQALTPAANGSFNGNLNTFFGNNAGLNTTTGYGNTFVGNSNGQNNLTGVGNVFVGGSTGFNHISGSFNSFFGDFAGHANTTGSNNTAVGYFANVGSNNLTYATAIGSGAVATTSNSIMLGRNADTVQVPGVLNITGTLTAPMINATTQFNLAGSRILSNAGTDNLIAGILAGNTSTGSNNTFYGFFAGGTNTTGSNNTYFGRRAGTTATGSGNSFFGQFAGGNFTGAGINNTFVGTNADFDVSSAPGGNNTLLGANSKIDMTGFGQDISFATAVGAGAAVQFSDMVIIGKVAGTYNGVARPADIVRIPGLLQVQTFGPTGGSPLCFNNGIALCSSSLRYKTDVRPYHGGLDILNRLMPISFTWKSTGVRDVGFGAEEVAEVEPLLTFKNDQGVIEGVDYGQISTVLVNAVKEQQSEIDQQRDEIHAQKQQLATLLRENETLKALVCGDHPAAALCKTLRKRK